MALSFLGFPINKTMTLISKDKVLDKKNGSIFNAKDILDRLFTPLGAPSPAPVIQDVEIKKEVEVVVGIDGKRIDFTLANSDGVVPSMNGFLVEVYLSGADGKLTRVFQEDVVDVVNDDTLSEGFSNYLELDIDNE